MISCINDIYLVVYIINSNSERVLYMYIWNKWSNRYEKISGYSEIIINDNEILRCLCEILICLNEIF